MVHIPAASGSREMLTNGAAARLRILWRDYRRSGIYPPAGGRNDPDGRYRGYQPNGSTERETNRRLNRHREELNAHCSRLDRHNEEIYKLHSSVQNEANDANLEINKLRGFIQTEINEAYLELRKLDMETKKHVNELSERIDNWIGKFQSVTNELSQAIDLSVGRLDELVRSSTVKETLKDTVDISAEEEPATMVATESASFSAVNRAAHVDAEAEPDTGSEATDAGIHSESLINAARRSLSPAVTGRHTGPAPRRVDTTLTGGRLGWIPTAAYRFAGN